MLRSKFHEVFASNQCESRALMRRSFQKDRNIVYSRDFRKIINLSQKQHSRKHIYSQNGNRYQQEKDIPIQPGQSSIDAKINLLKSPVYCNKKNKKNLVRHKTSNKNIKGQFLINQKRTAHRQSNCKSRRSIQANSLDRIIQQDEQRLVFQIKCDAAQQEVGKIVENINHLPGKHFRNLISVSSQKNIQFQVEKNPQNARSSHKKTKSIFQKSNNFIGAIQSKQIVVRQHQWSPGHKNYVGKIVSDTKNSQQILKRSSLFLVNFLKQKQKHEFKNQEVPHIGNIANTTGKMRIIVSKPTKKPTKTYGEVKHGASKSQSNFFGSGNSYIISPW